MTQRTKSSLKWTIGIMCSLVTLLTFTFFLGVGFAKNDAAHIAIVTKINTVEQADKDETIRSKAVDEQTVNDIGTIQTDIAVIKITYKAQAVILEKIEKKLP